MRRSHVLILVVLLALLVGAAAWWRISPKPAAEAAAGARRGGQVVASIRGEPRSWNRLVDRTLQTEIVSALTQARLVRINRATFELEPWLAERWEASDDGLTYTMHLREGIAWSDGTPFTADDVVFSLEALFVPGSGAVLGPALTVADRPIAARAADPHTVVFTYPAPSGPGIRLLDNLWILPKHKLEASLRAGTFKDSWNTRTPPADVAGLGPFVLESYEPGQRVTFARNPRYWRRDAAGVPLPYLERVVLEIVGDQNTELLRLTSGTLDIPAGELRPEDYVVVKRAADTGGLALLDLGVGPDADSFWFLLKPEAKKADPRFAFLQRREFRQAISHAIDRQQFADTVYLGAAVPIWGPVTPGNPQWYWADVPKYPHDLARARALLRGIGLEDRNGNGVVEDRAGTEARFTVLTQRGVSHYERATRLLRDEVAKAGIALDIAPLDITTMIGRMLEGNYDAIYYRFLLTDLDPGLARDFWWSSGSARVWNLAQASPATGWERRIDALMTEQVSAQDPARRREIFNEVQRIFAENLPILHFAAPRLYFAHSARLRGVTPSTLRPNVLWNADTLSVADAAPGTN